MMAAPPPVVVSVALGEPQSPQVGREKQRRRSVMPGRRGVRYAEGGGATPRRTAAEPGPRRGALASRMAATGPPGVGAAGPITPGSDEDTPLSREPTSSPAPAAAPEGAAAPASAVPTLATSQTTDAIANVQGMLTARRQRRGTMRLGRIASPGPGQAAPVGPPAAAAAPAAQKQQPPLTARRRKMPARAKSELVREESQGPVAWPSPLADIRAATVKEMEAKCVPPPQALPPPSRC